eukprot:CAMPEP_0170272670 /NCGR_PEP_ID=MMETSP0116_2-20130129/36295_1 /TAXON_ID=400756 /ORGANISM="Durinskia baltica, Strain CSIRO CS-38" /LENGTH=174 /DNA_ID=CAMNT_0010523893 /DNA_START=345 /DNA_END=864 /DNA_ORIENTATION=-
MGSWADLHRMAAIVDEDLRNDVVTDLKCDLPVAALGLRVRVDAEERSLLLLAAEGVEVVFTARHRPGAAVEAHQEFVLIGTIKASLVADQPPELLEMRHQRFVIEPVRAPYGLALFGMAAGTRSWDPALRPAAAGHGARPRGDGAVVPSARGDGEGRRATVRRRVQIELQMLEP